MQIRRAKIEDLEGILALETQFPTDRMSRRAVAHLLRSISACVFVVTNPESRIPNPLRGAIVVLFRKNSHVARIYSVVVDPASRGQGLGARLVVAAEQEARRRCRLMSLEVRQDNRAAQAMYRKLGYHTQLELPDYYEDGAPGFRLRKALL